VFDAGWSVKPGKKIKGSGNSACTLSDMARSSRPSQINTLCMTHAGRDVPARAAAIPYFLEVCAMKTKHVIAGLLLSVAGTGFAWADQPGADWMPKKEVEAKIIESGYTSVSRLDAENGEWVGKGLKLNSEKYRFRADPRTGNIIQEEIDREEVGRKTID